MYLAFDRNNFNNMLTLTPFLHGSDILYLWLYAWDISVTNTRTTRQENQLHKVGDGFEWLNSITSIVSKV